MKYFFTILTVFTWDLAWASSEWDTVAIQCQKFVDTESYNLREGIQCLQKMEKTVEKLSYLSAFMGQGEFKKLIADLTLIDSKDIDVKKRVVLLRAIHSLVRDLMDYQLDSEEFRIANESVETTASYASRQAKREVFSKSLLGFAGGIIKALGSFGTLISLGANEVEIAYNGSQIQESKQKIDDVIKSSDTPRTAAK